MASRSLCVPASGANVRPVFLPFCKRSISAMEKLSARSDGQRKRHVPLGAEVL